MNKQGQVQRTSEVRCTFQQWEYCLLTCTPLTGLDAAGVRLTYHLVTPAGARQGELYSDSPAPLAAIGQMLNELGAEGWELVAWDTTTNRGVFKRQTDREGGHA